MKWARIFWIAMLSLGCIQPLLAQQNSRTIRIIVPYAPGSAQDMVAHIFSKELGQVLDASVLVINRAGAGGTLGAAGVAKATPDGTTLLLAGSSHTVAPYLFAPLPYDPVKDFAATALLGYAGLVLAVPSSLGVQNLTEFLQYARSKPKQLNYASAGNASGSHLGMALLLAQANLQIQHIPMKSTGEAISELLAGRVDAVMAATLSLAGLRQDPRIKMLAYSGAKRSSFAPSLPTFAESGLPNFKYETWAGLLTPAGTPPAMVEQLNQAVQKALTMPIVVERLKKLGVETTTTSPDKFQQLLRDDWVQSGELIKASGATLN